MVTRGQFVIINNTDPKIPEPQSQITYILDVGSLLLDKMVPGWGSNMSEVVVYQPKITKPLSAKTALKRSLGRQNSCEKHRKVLTGAIAECIENNNDNFPNLLILPVTLDSERI